LFGQPERNHEKPQRMYMVTHPRF